MKRFRISVGGLMVGVVIAAIAIAALRSASELWTSLILTLTFGILATASLGAFVTRGERRTFWIGFGAFGWIYLILMLAPWFSEQIKPSLPPIGLLHRLGPLTYPGTTLRPTRYSGFRTDYSIWAEQFRRIAHSLLALLVGLIGGIIARFFAAHETHPTTRRT